SRSMGAPDTLPARTRRRIAGAASARGAARSAGTGSTETVPTEAGSVMASRTTGESTKGPRWCQSTWRTRARTPAGGANRSLLPGLPSRPLHLPLDVAEEAANGRGRFTLYEGPNQTLHEAGHRGVRGDRLREAHARAVLRRPLENDRAADVGVVALDWEALEADPGDAVALIARGGAGHHAHRAGRALTGDEAVGVGVHALAGGQIGHAA